MRTGLAALAALFLAAHLASLPPSLGDLDSINFALGVREFDVARHQPHPPGYPVFIGLAKVSTAVFTALGIPGAEVKGLAFWGAVFGALLIPALFALFRALDGSPRRAFWATLLTVASPLLWFTALRPLSDVAGLAAAVIAQALLVRAIMAPPAPRLLLLAAFAAGLAIGIRSQTFLLTLPLLAVALALPGSMLRARERAAALAALAAGVLFWALPLIAASGGLPAYVSALAQQGSEDFSGVVIFWTFPTLAVGGAALWHTFVSPWASPALGAVVLLSALAGLAALAAQRRTALIVSALAVPYAIFHLLFHEAVTVRYALPLVPVVAWLAVRGVDRISPRAVPAVGVAVAWALWLAVPAGIHHGTEPTPIFRALSDLAAARQTGHVTVASHRRVFTESRRVRTWLENQVAPWLASPRDFEWLELTRAWRSGQVGTVWFLADPHRTDLALIDSQGSRVVAYRWPFDGAVFMGGSRPDEFDAHVFTRPGWFLEEGWSLTPEVAGIAAREGWGPHVKPSVGWIRRRAGPADVVLGGRHLGAPTDAPVRLVAAIDGRTILDRELRPGFFHDVIALPAGSLAGDGEFARLLVSVEAEDGRPPVGLEQFNVQSAGVPMLALADGWHEPEYNPRTNRQWRWMSERAHLWVRPVGRDVTLRLAAESPGRYFDRAPTLRVTIGGELVSALAPTDDFTWEVTLTDAMLTAHAGRVMIESDLWFAPGGSDGTGDQRHLALRVYGVTVD